MVKKFKSKSWRVQAVVETGETGIKNEAFIKVTSTIPITARQAMKKARHIELPKRHSMTVKVLSVSSAYGSSKMRKKIRFIKRIR